MRYIACCARKSDEGKPKRSSSSGRPACRVDNYGLARKSTLMDIAARINRKTYKMYKTHNTEWLVVDGEQIGVQTKHKEELGMEMESFFRPSYPGAPQPSANSPVVVESRLTPNYSNFPHSNMNTSTFGHIKDQPKTGEFKKRNLDNLLNAEQVQLIDSKEVIERIQNFVKKVKDKRKVCKSKERAGSPLQRKKLSPQEVLRSSNRPKSKTNILSDHKKQSFRPDAEPTSMQKSTKIIYRDEQMLLPLNKDILQFFNNSKLLSSRRETAAEMGRININLKLKRNVKQTKRTVRKTERINRKKLESASNVWRSAVSIKLDKMNKKLPVANSKSYEDPDRTPRPRGSNKMDFRPRIRNTKVNEPRGKLNAIKKKSIEKRKQIKDKGKQRHYIKIEKIKQVKVNDWLEDTEMDTETDEQQRPDITNKKLNTAKKSEKSKEKRIVINTNKKPIEKRKEVKDKCKEQQKPEQNGAKQDWLENDTDEEEQVYLLGTEDEELMNAEMMDSKDSSASPKKQRAFTKFKMLIMKMKSIVIKSNRAAKNMSQTKMQVKERQSKAKEQQNVEANNVRTVAIYKPQKRTALVNAISPRLRMADQSEPPTAQMPMGVQVSTERSILQELFSLVEETSRGRDKSCQICELCKNPSKSKIWSSLGIRIGNFAKRTKLFPSIRAKSSKKELVL
ncbi:uncharacterized protein LOC6576367 isoform X2 [Drosophila mojavensis]|uniref:Uncharacterized protein n=1 Tax=Drosophila mojavensis TaxID=7230 RepID=B4KE55_DROMO|nr:uncharacterized protein LOC6576367 isoform X2 [Drosophila mojavensis]EDW11800.2 uncharacterized protein Dmoj_GI17342 [Drosophila mojavensis]